MSLLEYMKEVRARACRRVAGRKGGEGRKGCNLSKEEGREGGRKGGEEGRGGRKECFR